MDIDSLVKKLIALASQPSLTSMELHEAHETMRSLKAAGISNEEIVKITKNRWATPTIKGITKGTTAATPSPWQEVISLLTDVISAGMSIDGIACAMSLFKELNSKKLSIDGINEFLLAVESAGTDPVTLIAQLRDFIEANLSPKEAVEALQLKLELETNGLLLNSLPDLVKLTQKYGNTEKIMELVSAFGSLQDIENKIATGTNGLENIASQQVAADQKLKKTQDENIKLQEPIATLKKASELGFNEKLLADLSLLAEQYGGPKPVLLALKKFSGLGEIEKKVAQAKSQLNEYKSNISELETKHYHLTTAIKMCEALSTQYKFGLDLIATLWSLAQMYGEPINVLRAVEAYGKIEPIQNKYLILESKVAEKEKLLAQLEGKTQAVFNQLENLSAVALRAGASVTKIENQLEKAKEILKIVTLIYDPLSTEYVEYGPIVAVIAVSLRKWVKKFEKQLGHSYQIEPGLDGLLRDLGVN